MFGHDNMVQAKKDLQEAIIKLGKAQSQVSAAIGAAADTTSSQDTQYLYWGSAGTSGVWGSAGSAGYALGGTAGFISMAINAANLALAAVYYYPEQVHA